MTPTDLLAHTRHLIIPKVSSTHIPYIHCNTLQHAATHCNTQSQLYTYSMCVYIQSAQECENHSLLRTPFKNHGKKTHKQHNQAKSIPHSTQFCSTWILWYRWTDLSTLEMSVKSQIRTFYKNNSLILMTHLITNLGLFWQESCHTYAWVYIERFEVTWGGMCDVTWGGLCVSVLCVCVDVTWGGMCDMTPVRTWGGMCDMKKAMLSHWPWHTQHTHTQHTHTTHTHNTHTHAHAHAHAHTRTHTR